MTEQAWSIKDLFYGEKITPIPAFAEQSGLILPARVPARRASHMIIRDYRVKWPLLTKTMVSQKNGGELVVIPRFAEPTCSGIGEKCIPVHLCGSGLLLCFASDVGNIIAKTDTWLLYYLQLHCNVIGAVVF